MLTYDFAHTDGPMYEYIYKCIKSDILSGVLQPGEKLPSKRSFADNNGISTITIQNAYDQLVSEGYIYTLPRKGYFVSKIEKIAATSGKDGISLNIHVPEAVDSCEIDLSNNQMNPENFPFSVWAKVSRETISGYSRELMEISPTAGKPELRKAIAEHLKSFRGMLVDPNQIVVGAGTEYLYSLLIQLLGSGRKYCVENPGYKKLVWIYRQYQINCCFADVDEKGMTAEGLYSSGADIAHISPNHHFPTGIIMPASRRYEVLAWASEKGGRYIIEDDYDSEFRLSGKPIPTLFSIDACEKVIYINTFSKSLSPTIRISYMVLPVHLANLFYEQLSFYACTVSNFEQCTLAEFMRRGYFEKHINRMRLYYRRQRSKVFEVIDHSALKDCSEIIENDSGLHFILRLDTQLEDAVVTERLRERGIRLEALSEYSLSGNNDRQHMFIINYSNIESGEMNRACEEIFRCINKQDE